MPIDFISFSKKIGTGVIFKIYYMKGVLTLLRYLYAYFNKQTRNLNIINPINMKKLFYVLILAITSFATFTSCTEENIKPRASETPMGGVGSATKGA